MLGHCRVTRAARLSGRFQALVVIASLMVWFGPAAQPAAASASSSVADSAGHRIALTDPDPVSGTVVAWGMDGSGESDVPPTLRGVVAVAAGEGYDLALKSDGTVVAWGSDGFGETDVPAGLTGVTAIAAGGSHSLALKSDGTVVAWGWTNCGKASVPADLSGIVAIAAGANRDLALESDGTVVGWGCDDPQMDVPAGLSNVTAISVGDDFSLALQSDGTVVAWGADSDGQRNIPSDLAGVVAISAGWDYGLAVKADGTLAAWGGNGKAYAALPVGLTGITSVAAGRTNIALTSAGTVVQWANPGWALAMGDDRFDAPPGLSGVSAIAASSYNNLALVSARTFVVTGHVRHTFAGTPGSVRVEVRDAHGELDPSYRGRVHLTSSDPTAILPADYDFTEADAGVHVFDVTLRTAGNHRVTVADTASPEMTGSQMGLNVAPGRGSGGVVAWGSLDRAWMPSDLAGVVAVAVSDNVSLALHLDGTVEELQSSWWLTGGTEMPDGLWATAIAAGDSHCLALSTYGTVVAWGLNDHGQRDVPAGLSDVIAIAAGEGHSLALRSNGTVVAWGDDSKGQSSVPAGLSDVVAISAGGSHSLALRSDGTVVAWGDDSNGQSDVPPGLVDVRRIAAGGRHSLALKTDGTVIAWGDDTQGQTDLPAGLADVQAIAAGEEHSVAIKVDRTVVAWGDDSSGQTDVPAALPPAAAIAAGGHASFAVMSHYRLGGSMGPTVSTGVPVSVIVRTRELTSFVPGAVGMGDYPGYHGTVHFTSSDPDAVLPADYTYTDTDAGFHTFDVTLETRGSQDIRVTDTTFSNITGSLGEVVVTGASPGDWTQFRNGPTHEANNTDEKILSASNVASLGVSWTGAIGGGSTGDDSLLAGHGSSSPAVVDGVVYIGSEYGLRAFDADCGTGGGPCAPIWTGDTLGEVVSSPAVANGVVYVGGGGLFAFATGCSTGGGTCSPLWKGAPGWGMADAPTVADGVVYAES
jgi:alpha-tubulin suppressor-like RCC1 family protein